MTQKRNEKTGYVKEVLPRCVFCFFNFFFFFFLTVVLLYFVRSIYFSFPLLCQLFFLLFFFLFFYLLHFFY